MKIIIKSFIFLALLAIFFTSQASLTKDKEVVIGSKRFTESYILGEIAKYAIQKKGLKVKHKQGMGGTFLLWQALQGKLIDAYPEYTGTIKEVILKNRENLTIQQIKDILKEQGIGISDELGFNNSYAIAIDRDLAEKLGIEKISDLRNFPDLRIGLSYEFLKRQDGWERLSEYYGLSQKKIKGIEHPLGYIAINKKEVDLIDVFSTDAKLKKFKLKLLQDDLNFFPKYKAVFLYRLESEAAMVEALNELAGTISEERMIEINYEAELKKSYSKAASLYFGKTDNLINQKSFFGKIGERLSQHLTLVSISLLMAIIIGIPIGVLASKPSLFSQAIIGIIGIVQTIPSLALLALLVPIPFLGIKPQTAIIALFLYSLLPIVRNTASGLQSISTSLRESAEALGLSRWAKLTKIYLPLASPAILTGIKTSAILSIGTATLAALIGAGGLGEPIISGLNLNDNQIILQGAIPAAALAIMVQVLFDLIENFLIPRGLRAQKRN